MNERKMEIIYHIFVSIVFTILIILFCVTFHLRNEMKCLEDEIAILDIKLNSNNKPTAGVSNEILKNIDYDVTIKVNDVDSVESSNELNNKNNKNIDEEIKVNSEASEEPQNEPEFIEVESTAYYNKYNRKCADGTEPTYGVLAGKIEWLGKTVDLYNCNKEYVGEFTFHDTGYGQSTGHGSSRVLKGRSLGTIETGECIDIFMSTYEQCINYGRRKVYIVFKDE